MKKYLAIMAILFISLPTIACPVCEKQQPKILQGITHGAGPQSKWDYLIISITAVIVLVTLFYSIKWLVKPGEKSDTHIKHLILNNE
ncbi:MAG TPA: hypothetical protein PLL00_02855 [Bacteroidia bacterium]|nr:hypothetical protein [Bacteroidia bacterium]